MLHIVYKSRLLIHRLPSNDVTTPSHGICLSILCTLSTVLGKSIIHYVHITTCDMCTYLSVVLKYKVTA